MDPEKPDKSNPAERHIARDAFDEEYWGIKLSDIEDEFYLTKGNETLYIDAAGNIIIRTQVAGQPVETGRSYDSTEAMFIAENRWDELYEYQRKVAENVRVRDAFRDSTPTPTLVFVPDSPVVKVGEICRVGIVSRNLSAEKNRVVGIALRFQSAILAIESYEPGEAVTGLQYSAGAVTEGQQTAQFMVACPPGVGGGDLPLATLVFRGAAQGQTTLEPMAVEAIFAEGKTFVEVNGVPFQPLIESVLIHVS